MVEHRSQSQHLQKTRTDTPNLTGIPTQMKLDLEQRSGLSFDDVRVHYGSDRPAKLHASAYTQGTQVYIGPGQQRHLRHELGHVIQQKRGLVSADILYHGGIPANVDPMTERQADELSRAPMDSRGRQAVSPNGPHRQIVQFALKDHFNQNRQEISNILCALFELEEGTPGIVPPALQKYISQIRRDNEHHAMFYAWNDRPSNEFMVKIVNEIRQISPLARQDPAYVAYVQSCGAADVDVFLANEISMIVSELSQAAQRKAAQFSFQEAGAQTTYSNSNQNLYESVRGKPLKGGQRKMFLRRLARSGGRAASDVTADRKILAALSSSSPASTNIDDRQKPYLKAKTWTPIINDAFVGGAIDAGSRFDIRSLDPNTWNALEALTSVNMPPQARAEYFLKQICPKDPNLYTANSTKSYGYAVLAREIALLLDHGWIFRKVAGKKKTTLQAFKSEECFRRYLADKQRSQTPP